MDEELNGAGGEGFDMAAGLAEMSAGLGFDEDTPETEGVEGNEGELKGQPSGNAPAPTTNPPGVPANTPPVDDPTAAPPKTWRDGPKAKWAALDPEVRAEIVKREDDFFKGIEGYKADASVGKQLSQVIAPFKPILDQHGIDPMQEIAGLMQAHHTLALGTPQQRVQMFKQLLGNYNIKIEDLTGTAADAPYIAPEVEDLRSRTERLESTLNAQQQAQLQQQQERVRSEILAFSNDPANIYFKELAQDMSVLIKSGVVKNLQEAYDKALWANPAVREKELLRQQQEREKAAETERLNRLKAAKKAEAARPTPTGRVSPTAPAGESMEDTMRETLREIRRRDK